MKTTDPQDEIFPVVNEKDEIIGKITRKKAHMSPSVIHRAIYVLIFDQEERMLIQKRSLTKDTSPGCWCGSVTGHVGYKEDYASVAVREVAEEMGITIKPSDLQFLGKILVIAPWEKEMTQVYKVKLEKKVAIQPHPEEVSETRFVSMNTLKEMVTSQKWSPSAQQVFLRFVI